MALRSCLCGLFASKKRKSQAQSKVPLSEQVKLQPVVSTPPAPQENAGRKEAIDPKEIEKIRELCPRFRILIIGRANSGKTTIVRKVCDANDDPIVHDEKGNEVPASELKGPDAKRGIHNIRLEITYASNPGFVFHDSMGFEAGSAEELEAVRQFIKEMLAKTELRHRLHAIWYCIPTDSSRVASEAELSFFQENTGDIPVILLFTKWDGQVKVAYNTLRQRERMDKPLALEEAPRRAKQILDEEFIPVFNRTPHPPASFTILENMHKPETRCSELSEKTEAALDNSVLKKLFVRVQTHNIQICVKGAIKEAISRAIFSDMDASLKHSTVVAMILSWFPHIFVILLRFSMEWDQARDYSAFQYETLFLTLDDKKHLTERIEETGLLQMFEPTVSSSKEAFSSLYLQLCYTAAAVTVIAAHSFGARHASQNIQDTIQPSIDTYVARKREIDVMKAIQDQLHQYVEPVTSGAPDENQETTIREALINVCIDNLMG